VVCSLSHDVSRRVFTRIEEQGQFTPPRMRTNAASAAAEGDSVNQTDRDPTVDTIRRRRLEEVQLQLAERVRAAPSEHLPMDECDYMEVFGG
jgi:hypothetical protein